MALLNRIHARNLGASCGMGCNAFVTIVVWMTGGILVMKR
jgi:hypothetical protein